jgi:hypothetical protein
MTMFVFAALTVTAFIWAITEPQDPQDLTPDEISQLVDMFASAAGSVAAI